MNFDFFGDLSFWVVWVAGILLSIPVGALAAIFIPTGISLGLAGVGSFLSLNPLAIVAGVMAIALAALPFGAAAAAGGLFWGPLGLGLFSPAVTAWLESLIPQLKPIFDGVGGFLPWLF